METMDVTLALASAGSTLLVDSIPCRETGFFGYGLVL